MKKHLSEMCAKTRLKCLGVIVLVLVSTVLLSVWQVKLEITYTDINGTTSNVGQGPLDILCFGFICILSECLTFIRSIFMDNRDATHETEVVARCEFKYEQKNKPRDDTERKNDG